MCVCEGRAIYDGNWTVKHQRIIVPSYCAQFQLSQPRFTCIQDPDRDNYSVFQYNHNYVLLTQAVGIERQKTFTNYVEILRFIQLVIVCFDATNLLDSYLQWCDITDDGFAKNSQWTWLSDTRPMRRGTSLDSQHKFTDVTLELGGKVVLSLVLIFFSLFFFIFQWTAFKTDLDSFKNWATLSKDIADKKLLTDSRMRTMSTPFNLQAPFFQSQVATWHSWQDN